MKEKFTEEEESAIQNILEYLKEYPMILSSVRATTTFLIKLVALDAEVARSQILQVHSNEEKALCIAIWERANSDWLRLTLPNENPRDYEIEKTDDEQTSSGPLFSEVIDNGNILLDPLSSWEEFNGRLHHFGSGEEIREGASVDDARKALKVVQKWKEITDHNDQIPMADIWQAKMERFLSSQENKENEQGKLPLTCFRGH